MADPAPAERVAALRKVPLFSGLSDTELESVLEDSGELTYLPGQDLVTQGDASGPFFLLLEGRCQVLVDGVARKVIGAGQYFGDMALVDNEPRSATVRAETNVRALAIPAAGFFRLLETNFGVVRKIMANLSRRARAAERQLNS